MYYDDQTRRFNFLSGLTLGAVLGAGLALLVAPQERVRAPALLRRGARRRSRGVQQGWTALREGMADSMAEALEAGRAKLRSRG